MSVVPAPSVERISSQGFERFDLLAWRPLPQYGSALLGEMILGAVNLPDDTVHDDGAILGDMHLNTAILGKEPQFNAWQSIIAPATRIAFHRGVEANIFSVIGTVGTLSAEIYNDLDPRSSYLYRGTPIALIDRYANRILFQGTIATSKVEPSKDQTYRVSFEAVDIISTLADIHKYQETADYPRNWYDVVDVLLREFTYEIPVRTYAPKIGNIVKESNLAQYLDLIANTAGIYWHITRTNTLRFITTLPSRLSAAFIADDEQDTSLPKLYLTDIQAVFDTSNLTSVVRLENSQSAKNTEGEWESTTNSFEVRNEQKILQYGVNVLSLETVGADVDAIKLRIQHALSAQRPNQIVSKAGIDTHIDIDGYEQTITTALSLDLFDRVKTSFRNSIEEAHITAIDVEITPKTFHITYDLRQA